VSVLVQFLAVLAAALLGVEVRRRSDGMDESELREDAMLQSAYQRPELLNACFGRE